MRPTLVLALSIMLFTAAAQEPPQPPIPNPRDEPGDRLPNGKSQKEAIAKEDYQKSLEDARELIKASESLLADLEKNDRYVISVSELRKTDEIEKLAKRIRGRLKRY
jgi:hypothetical protein